MINNNLYDHGVEYRLLSVAECYMLRNIGPSHTVVFVYDHCILNKTVADKKPFKLIIDILKDIIRWSFLLIFDSFCDNQMKSDAMLFVAIASNRRKLGVDDYIIKGIVAKCPGLDLVSLYQLPFPDLCKLFALVEDGSYNYKEKSQIASTIFGTELIKSLL